MSTKTKELPHLDSVARFAGLIPFETYSGNYGESKSKKAERLMGDRSHYYDAGTLRFFFCVVSEIYVTDNGLILGTISRQAKDMNNTSRGYTFALHDLGGTYLGPPVGDGRPYFNTLDQARKAFWQFANTLDAATVLRDAIERKHAAAASETARMANALKQMGKRGKRAPEPVPMMSDAARAELLNGSTTAEG